MSANGGRSSATGRRRVSDAVILDSSASMRPIAAIASRIRSKFGGHGLAMPV